MVLRGNEGFWKRVLMIMLSFIVIVGTFPSKPHVVKAADSPKLIVDYSFTDPGNGELPKDKLSGSTLTEVPDDVNGKPGLYGNTTKEYGSDRAGNYWRWTSDKGRGGGLTLDINPIVGKSLDESYSVRVQFSYANFSTNWTKIIDYKNKVEDTGFYFNKDKKLKFYNVGNDGITSIKPNQIIDIIATRDASSKQFTVFMSVDGEFQREIAIEDTGKGAMPVKLGTGGKIRFGFFHDDYKSSGEEKTTDGKVYSIQFWDGAISPAQVLNAMASKGTAAETTKITVNSPTGNSYKAFISDKLLPFPLQGEDVPVGAKDYIPGSDIAGVNESTTKYVGIYEIDASGKIVGFKLITLAADDITAPAPVVQSAKLEQVTTGDKQISLTFDQEVALNDLNGFLIKVGNEEANIGDGNFAVDSTDSKKLIITLPAGTDVSSKLVNVTYKGSGTLKGKNTNVTVNPFSIDAVNKFALQAKVNAIEGENLEKTEYTPGTWAELEAKQTAAKNVLSDVAATQQQVNEALAALTKAFDDLKKVEAVDKTGLQNKVNAIEGENLVKTEYTPGTWAELEAKQTAAKNVLSDAAATQQQVNEALAALNKARDDLKKVEAVDKTALQNKVNAIEGENLVKTEYTPGTWAELEAKQTAAKNVLSDAAATQQQVNEALAALTKARDGLQNNSSTATLTIEQPAGSTVSDSKPVIAGKVGAGSTVTVVIKDRDGKPVANASGTAVVNGDTWTFIPSAELDNGDYTIVVTAAKDNRSSTVNKELKVDTADQSALTGLQLNIWNGTPIGLSPDFKASTTKYTASVTNSVYAVTILPTALDPAAKIEISVNNAVYQKIIPSGVVSGDLLLNVGSNTINVKVTDSKGKVTEYALIVTRESAYSGSNGSSGGSFSVSIAPPAKDESGIKTSVNGDKDTFATGKKSTEGDRQITLIQVDLDKLNKALSQGNGQKLAIHSPKDGDMKVDGLTAGTVKQLADKGANLEISNPLAIYPTPGGKMDLNAVSSQLGNAALGDIAVHIDITRSSDALISNAKSKAAAGGYELLVTPVDLDLTFSHDSKTVRSGQLNGYAGKYIALPEGIDPNRITTGVIVNPDGSVFHMPTIVTKIDNRYYAWIKDLRSHGSYSVIWNPQDFDDVKNHWGQSDVNNIAARLDLKGTGNNTFSPDRNVTRSEFSEIVALGLGLMRQNVPQNVFPDVSDSAWYRNAVTISNEFDIVRGYEDGNFHGNKQITREEGIAMIARAYSLINPQAKLSQDSIESQLSKYTDAKSVSDWAKEDVARMIEAGIVQGDSPQLLSPQSNMTRAETAALIARLLKTTNLIDK
ncbi:S-layer homology domain-containing protein [Paenibacillus elgii]